MAPKRTTLSIDEHRTRLRGFADLYAGDLGHEITTTEFMQAMESICRLRAEEIRNENHLNYGKMGRIAEDADLSVHEEEFVTKALPIYRNERPYRNV